MKKYPAFTGGMNIPSRKSSARLPIEEMPAPDIVVLPLNQHHGSPAVPLVTKGKYVRLGQKIADADGHISAPIHATVSGTVISMGKRVNPITGEETQSITIESDGRDDRAPRDTSLHEYFRFTPKELLAVIKDAGIVGLGGGAFPAHAKLTHHKNAEPDILIINACECEPYLSADHRILKEHPKEVVEGVKIMMHVLDAVKAIIAVEDDESDAVQDLKKIIFNEPNIFLAVLKSRYPQGSEKHLTRTLTGRIVPSGKHPVDIGVVVNNVSTVYAVAKAVKEGEPLTSRVLTVAGGGIRGPRNLKVRIGTLLRDIAAYCGGTTDALQRVVLGGPMMGVPQDSLDVPALKCTTGVLFLSKQECLKGASGPCFRCGFCARVCPMKLLPQMLSVNIEKGRSQEAARYYPDDCIECGCCAYVCPSGRPITEQIRGLKTALRERIRSI